MKANKIKKSSLRQQRIFSEAVRKQIVKDIEEGKCSVAQAAQELQTSLTTVYNWIQRYSRYLGKNRRMVIEEQSEGYRSKELEKRLKELEAIIGRKQMEIDMLNKIIDFGNQEYKTDLKKNLSKNPSTGSGPSKE